MSNRKKLNNQQMKMLNIVCGGRYHRDWINVDFHKDSNAVQKVNILKGLPFDNDSVDVIYCSHFLEHLSQEQAEFVLYKTKRVLKDEGICRIVVPDLENICKEYLKILKEVKTDPSLDDRYNWITIELLDQFVRVNSGGKMGKVFKEVSKTEHIKLADSILERVGSDLIREKEVSE